MLVALLELFLGTAPSSLEWERDLECELDLDLDLERDFLLLLLEEDASDEESSPVKTGLKRQKYFLWPLRASTWPL